MDGFDVMMENGSENMNDQVAGPVLDKPMSVLSQVPRTPLMDVKNQFRAKARQRKSTGSMTHSNFNVKHRLSLNDQECSENFQSNVKVFKQPNDGDEKGALRIPVLNTKIERDCQEDALSLIQSSCDMSTFADTVDESVLQEKLGELSMGGEEISADGDFLKDIMSVLDQDMPVSDHPAEQEETFTTLHSLQASVTCDDSKVESTEQILYDIQAIELENTFEGDVESVSDVLIEMNGGDRIHEMRQTEAPFQTLDVTNLTLKETSDHEHFFEDLQISESNSSCMESMLRKGNESAPNEGTDFTTESDSELTFSEEADCCFERLSSSLRESMNGPEAMTMSSSNVGMIGEGMHELSSIRLVEGCDDLTFDASRENTFMEDQQQYQDYNISELEKCVARLNLEGGVCRVDGLVDNGKEGSHELSDSATSSLLADLSISEAEALNCFDCTADMSKFIDDFLKETPVLDRHPQRLPRIKPRTVGKRDDIWPGEKDNDDDQDEDDDEDHVDSRDKRSVFTVNLNTLKGDEEDDRLSRISFSSNEDSDCSGQKDQLAEKVVEGRMTEVEDEGDHVRLLPEGKPSDGVDDDLHLSGEEESSTLCGKEASEQVDEVSIANSESLPTQPVDQVEKIDESADLYSIRVTKVLETLREACVRSNTELVSTELLPMKLSTDVEALNGKELSKTEVEDVRTDEIVPSAQGVVSGQLLSVIDEKSESQESAAIEEVCDLDSNCASDDLKPTTCGCEMSEPSDLSLVVKKLDVCTLSENEMMLSSANGSESGTAASSETDSSQEDEEDASDKTKQVLNRSTIEMREEVKTLELQMAELKQKVAWLESQIESNSNSQHESEEQSQQNNDLGLVYESKGSTSTLLQRSDLFVDENKSGPLLMDDIEKRLAEELLKTQDLESHVKDVERKCSLLEKERLSSELNFAKEVRRLKAEYTQSVDHQQAGVEQNVETMHQEFDCMMLEFERLTTLQEKLKAMLNRVMRTTNESLAGYAKLLKDYATLQQTHQNTQAQLSSSLADNKKLVDDVDVLENLLQRSNDSIKDLHQLYQEEIENLKSQVSSLSQALDEAAKEKANTKKGLDCHVDQLQQSLDRLETERHTSQEELEDARFLLEHQKMKNQALSDEVEDLRKIKVEWMAGQDWVKELEENFSFLNEEKEALDTEFMEAKKNVASLEDQVKSLRLANEEYKNGQDQLQMEVSSLRERLFVTGEDATMLLATLEDVESMAESLVDTLQQKFGAELCESTKTTPKQHAGSSSLVAQILGRAGVEGGQHCPNTGSKLSSVKSKSFLRRSNVVNGSVEKMDQALSAVLLQSQSFSNDVPSSRKALDFSSPASLSRPGNASSVALSSSLAYEREYAGGEAGQQDGGEGSKVNASIPGFAHIRSIPMSGKKKNEEEARLSSASEDSNILTICENVLESVEQKFSAILKMAVSTHRASRIKIRDLKGEVDLLSEKCRTKRDLAAKLESELESKRKQLGESREEIEQLNERVNRMTQAILKHEDLTYEVKRLEEDNQDLQQEVTNLKGERDMMSAQVQELIAKASGGDGQQASLTKIAALEKKIYHLNRYMLQEQEKTTEKGSKAMRRIRVLEMNLKRAEEEVYKFDELVEAIRNTCIENRSIRPHPVLLHVVRLIDGLVDMDKTKTTSVKANSNKTVTVTTTNGNVTSATTTTTAPAAGTSTRTMTEASSSSYSMTRTTSAGKVTTSSSSTTTTAHALAMSSSSHYPARGKKAEEYHV